MLALAPLGDRRGDVELDIAELFDDRRTRYGPVYAHHRLCRDVVSLWRVNLRGTMLQDLRFGLRLFRKHPLPVGITIGGLALAIGVVTSVFSIVNASMLRPFGMDEPASVFSVTRAHEGRAWPYWSLERFQQLHAGATLSAVEASFEEGVRYSAEPGDDGEAGQRLFFVSGGYLQVLGGRPALGRVLAADDDRPGAPAAVVVSHSFWTSKLSADASVIGRTLWLNGAPVTLVGVLRPEFTGPTSRRPSIWAPIATLQHVFSGQPFEALSSLEVFARIAPGATPQAAEDNLTAIAAGATAPGATPPRVQLFAAASPIDGPDKAEEYIVISTVFAIAGLVLALACANAANLLLAGASTRMREIGVRLALGSTPRRLMRQMVHESLLLGVIAGALGLVFSYWAAPILAAVIDLPPEVNALPDANVLLFAVAVAIVCGVGAGLSPARHGARADVLAVLKSQHGQSGRAIASSRLLTSFVGFQAAVSMLLLVIAVLLARTATVITGSDVGFDIDKLLAVELYGPRSGFDEPAYSQAALAVVRAVPGVEQASLTQSQPFGNFGVTRHRLPIGATTFFLRENRVDADYVSTSGLRLVQGRVFTADEVTREAPVAVITESVARTFFPGLDPIGLFVPRPPWKPNPKFAEPPPLRIVGVVKDVIAGRLEGERYGASFRPIELKRANFPGLLIRTADPSRISRAVEEALRRVDSRVRVTPRIVQAGLENYLGQTRMFAWLSGLIAVLALILAALGVYGVTAFVVGQRTQEISVRMAIGASAADMLRLLVRDSLRPVLIGLAVGLLGALGVSRVIASEMITGISPYDPLSIGVAIATLTGSALVAVVLPARRAARADPASVLRQV